MYASFNDDNDNNKCGEITECNISFECKNGIFLEPRLQEYIKKKMFYKKNNILPNISAEQEFSITQEDVRRLKVFLKGEKDLYNFRDQERFIDENNEQPKFEFDPDAVYKADPRYKRFVKKVNRDREAIKQRHSYGEFDEDYRKVFDQPDIDSWKDKIDDTRNDNKYAIKNLKKSNRTYTHPKPKRAGIVRGQDNQGIRDISTESGLQNSLTTRGGKSIGYSNPSEHYYDYISDDFQNPNNVVFERGTPTRLDNYTTARKKPYKREILN